MPREGAATPLVVLDDDPTGTQAAAGVPVVLRWSADELRRAAAACPPAVYVLTNTRAQSPEQAAATVTAAATAARDVLPGARVVLRGDSTLRGHLLPEHRALRAVVGGPEPVLLLVPAMPPGGRVTVDGVHFLERDGRREPLHATEYARDPLFGYRDARLLAWAQERSGGFFGARDGAGLSLVALRSPGGADALADVLVALSAHGRPAVCAPDAETADDLRVIADGLGRAEARGAAVLVRAAPTFAAVLGGCLATAHVAPPRGRTLVVCGSWVPTTTRQLAHLDGAYPGALVEAPLEVLTAQDPAPGLAAIASAAAQRLARDGLAVVATPRGEPAPGATSADAQRGARTLARVLHHLPTPPEVLVTKGGVTSAVTVTEGLRAGRAEVVGPVRAGVACWRATTSGGTTDVVVFPGNVGDAALTETVASLLPDPGPAQRSPRGGSPAIRA